MSQLIYFWQLTTCLQKAYCGQLIIWDLVFDIKIKKWYILINQ